MKYCKPEIVASAEAVRGIQGQTQKIFLPSDNSRPNEVFDAVAAYEADE